MKRIFVVITLILMVGGTAGSESWTNSDTGVMELFTGEIRLNEIYSAEGVLVGPQCTLIVEGNVNAGKFFVCRGGTIHITGKLTAEVIYFDSAEGELLAEIGELSAKYYTQCGGTVKVAESIVARTNGGDDGHGIVTVNSEFAVFGKTRLIVGGGVYARGGDIRSGNMAPCDEASYASFFAERGIAVTGYHFETGGGKPYVNVKNGLNATDGGTVFRDYT